MLSPRSSSLKISCIFNCSLILYFSHKTNSHTLSMPHTHKLSWHLPVCAMYTLSVHLNYVELCINVFSNCIGLFEMRVFIFFTTTVL